MKKCVDTSSSMSVQDVTFTACEDGMWGWGGPGNNEGFCGLPFW